MNYIVHSACNGSMPPSLAGISYFNRNSLLATMMRNREAVRYIVAPFGFGKSLLACAYAALINNLEHTYWLDGQNPCFLRDLDARTLLPDLLDETTVGDLVVLDDVLYLGATRRTQVWELCSGLVRAGREVVLCATPSADPLRGHEEACVYLGPTDLLYTDADLENLRGIGLAPRQDLPALHPARRVPALATNFFEANRTFLAAHIADMDDPAQSALSFMMLVLERGTFEELEMLLGLEITASDIDGAGLRAFMQVDECSSDFAALGFSLEDILAAFAPVMSAVAGELGAEDPGEFAIQVADALLQRDEGRRATQLLLRLCEPHRRSIWLREHQDLLLDMCDLAAAEQIYDSLRSERWRTRPELYTASCIRKVFLDYAEGALEELAAIVDKVDFPLEERLRAASFAYLLTEDVARATELEETFSVSKTTLKKEAENLPPAAHAQWLFWSKVGQTRDSNVNLVGSILGGKKALPQHAAILAVACCIHSARIHGKRVEDMPQLQKKVATLFDSYQGDGHNAAFALLRQEIDAFGIELDVSAMGIIAAYHCADMFEDKLEVQRSLYARGKAVQVSALSTALRAQVLRMGEQRRGSDTIPPLCVNLFGQFYVRLGDTVIEHKEFKRQKVRTLLAVLVLECGRDLSCDNIAKRLWPDSSDMQARHNLYNCISILRKGLLLADGSCPYISRPHGIVGLDPKFVQSDVAAIKECCGRLRHSEPDAQMYYHLLEELRELYKGDLLPSEKNELMVVAAREEWRNKVVNALLFSARRLTTVGESAVTLQLAEQALAFDPTREDCYEQLMLLQARFGQRPAAIDTWLRYRQYLNEELGLDPSPRVSQLYETIISEKGIHSYSI